MARQRPGWLILLLVLIGGGAAWAWRFLKDDDAWTPAAREPWEPAPSPAPAPVPTAPAPSESAPDAPASDPEPTDAEADAADAAEPAAAEPEREPEPEAAEPEPEPAEPDNLTRIEGVGPKIGAALAGAGLTTYAAVADADEDTLRAALTAANLRFAPSLPTWSKQARLLADGDEAGFTALTDRLSGGRES